jgi:putative flippase GtrA
MRRLVSQFARFGIVGAVGLVVDVTVFNLLRATLLDPHVVPHGQLWSNVVSTGLAIAVNWMGNRHWTFRHARRRDWAREAVEFTVVSIGGLGISMACLWVSSHALGLTDVVADNVSKNVVGLILGTAFRFTFYRLWVFRGERVPAVEVLGVELPEDRIGEREKESPVSPTGSPSARSRRAPGPASVGGAPQRG